MTPDLKPLQDALQFRNLSELCKLNNWDLTDFSTSLESVVGVRITELKKKELLHHLLTRRYL